MSGFRKLRDVRVSLKILFGRTERSTLQRSTAVVLRHHLDCWQGAYCGGRSLCLMLNLSWRLPEFLLQAGIPACVVQKTSPHSPDCKKWPKMSILSKMLSASRSSLNNHEYSYLDEACREALVYNPPGFINSCLSWLARMW